MKKLTIYLLSIIVMIFMLSNVVLAANLEATVLITPEKTTVKAGEEVIFNIKIKDIANADGGTVSAIGGKITYNKDFFETIDENDAGTVTVNSLTGEFNLTFVASSDKDVGKIKLKVKANPTGEGTVTFSELTASDGETETAATTLSTTITLEQGSQGGSNETTGGNTTGENTTGGNTTSGGNTASGNTIGGNTSGGTNSIGGNSASGSGKQNNLLIISTGNTTNSKSSTKDNTVASSAIPRTGIGATIIGGVCVLSIIALVTYKKYKFYRTIK